MSQTLEELGQLLREERELRGLSVEHVAEGLKISTRILYAIEAGDSNSLPHIVYVRGFVSAYAKYLELDIQDILASPVLYEREEPEQNSVKHVKKVNPSNPVSPSFPQNAYKFNFPLLITLCICIGGGYAMWHYRDADMFSSLQSTSLSIAEPAPVFPPARKSTEKTANIPQKNTEPKNAQPVAQTEGIFPPQKNAASPKNVASPKNYQEIIQIPEIATEHAVPHKVVVTVLNEGKIEANADDAGLRGFSVKAGEIFVLTFDATLVLNIGEADGVRVHYNGKEMSTGETGEAKTLFFPPKV